MSNIQLFNDGGWGANLPALAEFNIKPEIRAHGTISKGFAPGGGKNFPTKSDHFIVHFKPVCIPGTKTDGRLLSSYGIDSDKDLKVLHVGMIDPMLGFSTGRFKFGGKSGVMCSSDDNVIGNPLMDVKDGSKTILELGVKSECQHCVFSTGDNPTCSTILMSYFLINSPNDDTRAPYLPTQLFKMTIPKKARNPFFGDLKLAMQLAYSLTLQYGIDQQHFPQSMIPFRLELMEQSSQYYDATKKSQVKTTFNVPVIALDYDRMCKRLEKYADQFGGRMLAQHPEETKMISQGSQVIETPQTEQEIPPTQYEQLQKIVDFCPHFKAVAHLENAAKKEGWSIPEADAPKDDWVSFAKLAGTYKAGDPETIATEDTDGLILELAAEFGRTPSDIEDAIMEQNGGVLPDATDKQGWKDAHGVCVVAFKKGKVK